MSASIGGWENREGCRAIVSFHKRGVVVSHMIWMLLVMLVGDSPLSLRVDTCAERDRVEMSKSLYVRLTPRDDVPHVHGHPSRSQDRKGLGMRQIRRPTRSFWIIAALLTWATITIGLYAMVHDTPPSSAATDRTGTSNQNPFRWNARPGLFGTAERHRHVAIATTFGPHFEVYVPLAWTFAKALGRPDQSLQVYTKGIEHEFRGYTTVMKDLGMYAGDGERFRSPALLLEDIKSTTPSERYEDDPEALIDMVVLATCEVE